jgi:putative transposase
VVYRQEPWCDADAVELATLTWVDWFNTRRRLEPPGHVPPTENEQAYYTQIETPTEGVGLN